MSKKNVVIVGAGGAGAHLARALSGKLDATRYNLVLIAKNPFYIHYPGTVRMVVTAEGKLEDQVLVPFDRLFVNGNGTFRQGTVEQIDAAGKTITLASGDKVSYDVLVLATGSSWEGTLAFPETKQEADAFIAGWRDKFAKSNDIVFLGGGAVGAELAGEVKYYYPQKNVTIVHNSPLLMNSTYPDKFRRRLGQILESKQVHLVLNDSVNTVPEYDGKVHMVKTALGKEIKAELVVPTRGGKPNTAFIATLGADALSHSGHVRIRPTMQLASHDDIFAAGDIIDYKEQKQVGKYGGHVTVLVANVLALLEGRPLPKQYKGIFEAIAVSVGKNSGLGYFGILWGIVLGPWLTSLLKSKSLFIGMTRKNLGQLS